MNLSIRANARGSAPTFTQSITVEGHAAGVDLVLPRQEGTISKESALDFANALWAAAGGTTQNTSAVPAGVRLVGDAANGFTLLDASGAEVKRFSPVREVTHYA